jgi:hypothetical protein
MQVTKHIKERGERKGEAVTGHKSDTQKSGWPSLGKSCRAVHESRRLADATIVNPNPATALLTAQYRDQRREAAT